MFGDILFWLGIGFIALGIIRFIVHFVKGGK